jgi:site-specific recombinase XerD
MLREIDTDTFVEPSKQTVADFIKQWLESKRLASANSNKEGISTRTHIDYAQKLSYAVDEIGHLRLDKVHSQHIQALYNKLSERGLSASTVRGVHRVLKQAFARAEAWRLIQRNPTEHVERARVVKQEMKVFNEEQVSLFLEKAKGTEMLPLWLLMFSTGMRPQEVFALKWSDVQLTNVRVKRDGKFIDQPPQYCASSGHSSILVAGSIRCWT